MNRYSCYLFNGHSDAAAVREITADFDVKAVFLARTAATEAGYSRSELRQHHRVVRRENCRLAA